MDFAVILVICSLPWMTSCTDNTDYPNDGAGYSTTLFVATDVNGDGSVAIDDAVMLVNMLVGKK